MSLLKLLKVFLLQIVSVFPQELRISWLVNILQIVLGQLHISKNIEQLLRLLHDNALRSHLSALSHFVTGALEN